MLSGSRSPAGITLQVHWKPSTLYSFGHLPSIHLSAKCEWDSTIAIAVSAANEGNQFSFRYVIYRTEG